METPLCEMVYRRPAQRQLQLPGPASRHPHGQQGGLDLGGRTRRPGPGWRGTHPHLPATPSRSLPLCQRPQTPRHPERRPRHHLPAHGSGSRHRHARLRPHRRRPLRRLRRLQRPIRGRPHFRLPGQTGHHRRRRFSPRQHRPLEKERGRGARAQRCRRTAPRRHGARMSSSCAAPATTSISRKAATSGGTASWNTSRPIVPPKKWTAKRRFLYFTPAARRASPRASCTPPAVICSAPSSPPASSSICATKMSIGVPPTSAGSPATATSCTARWPTARRASCTKALPIFPSRTASGASWPSTASRILYTAPTAIRAFMKWGARMAGQARSPLTASPGHGGRADQPGSLDVVPRSHRPKPMSYC